MNVEQLIKKIKEMAQEQAHENGMHLKKGQLEQVVERVLEELAPYDVGHERLGLSSEDELMTLEPKEVLRLYLKNNPTNEEIEELEEAIDPTIGNAIDFFMNDWYYECI